MDILLNIFRLQNVAYRAPPIAIYDIEPKKKMLIVNYAKKQYICYLEKAQKNQ